MQRFCQQRKLRALLVILIISSVVTGDSYYCKQSNPKASVFLSTNHRNYYNKAKQNDIRKGLEDFKEVKSPPQTLHLMWIILGCLPISNISNPCVYNDSHVYWAQLYNLIQYRTSLRYA